MPARDLFHDAVVHALQKEGWTITDDPLTIRYGTDRVSIDLGAERLLAAERGNEKIAVEIKSFLGDSELSEYHAALGQFLNYRLVLQRSEPDRLLYLAIPSKTYQSLFSRDLAQDSAEQYQVQLLVYDPDQEVITQWPV